MTLWQETSTLDTLEDYLDVPTLSEDLNDINEIMEEEYDR